MNRISSNTTLFWKLFFPTLYITIFGLFGLVILLGTNVEWSFWSIWYIRLSYWLLFLTFVCLLYFTIMTLKRVEMDDKSFIATNYIKAYRYSIEDIESYHKYDFLILKLHSIHLKSKGKFGRKIRFIPFMVGLQSLTEKYPHIDALVNKV